MGFLQERIHALENPISKDSHEEHKLAFFQPPPLPCMQLKQPNTEKGATVSYSDARPEVRNIFSLEEAHAWMEQLRDALSKRNTDIKKGDQNRLDLLWRRAPGGAAFRALFCGKEVACGEKKYQITIEDCLINFSLAVAARAPAIFEQIWLANEDSLSEKISTLSHKEQIELLRKVLMTNLDLIEPYVKRVTDIAVLEAARDNLSGDSRPVRTKRTILQRRIEVLEQTEPRAIVNTQPIFCPPPQTAAGLAQFGFLPPPPVVPVLLDLAPTQDVLEAFRMLDSFPTRW